MLSYPLKILAPTYNTCNYKLICTILTPGERQLHRPQRHSVDALRRGPNPEEGGAGSAARYQLLPAFTDCDPAFRRVRSRYGCYNYC